MNNGDKIRSMTNQELWWFLDKVTMEPCYVCAFKDKPIRRNRNCTVGFFEWCKQESSD